MAVVKEICDRVAVMEHGRVVEQGVFRRTLAPGKNSASSKASFALRLPSVAQRNARGPQ